MIDMKHGLIPVSHGAVWRVAVPFLLGTAFASGTLLVATPREVAAVEQQDTCESCHSNPDFLVTNRKLHEYFQEWSDSVHHQEDVTCDDCHGGDSTASDRVLSHGDGVGAADPSSGIYYKNVIDTCGTCHEDVLDRFRESEHFEHVEKEDDGEQGPTCVTCHGAINSEILNVNSVADSCAQCHNEETDNYPENPAKAKAVLNRFLSINRFYRYITIRAEPEEAWTFFQKIDPKVEHLSMTWHTFDLEKIDEETREVLGLLTAKRDEIRARRKKTPPKPAN